MPLVTMWVMLFSLFHDFDSMVSDDIKIDVATLKARSVSRSASAWDADSNPACSGGNRRGSSSAPPEVLKTVCTAPRIPLYQTSLLDMGVFESLASIKVDKALGSGTLQPCFWRSDFVSTLPTTCCFREAGFDLVIPVRVNGHFSTFSHLLIRK